MGNLNSTKKPYGQFRLDTDFRWLMPIYEGPEVGPPAEDLPEGWQSTYSNQLYKRPLADATSVCDVEAYQWPNPAWWRPPDFAAARRQWPDHALVFRTGWMPLFCGGCEVFGIEEALMKMVTAPDVFEAFVQGQHEFYMDILGQNLAAGRDICDICWLGDDYASQETLLMNPDLWRRLIKPYLAEEVQLARDHDMFVIFHSCGAVRSILSDLIDIGMNGLMVFQTTANGMDAQPIADEFGGRLAFYGGVDIQDLLTFGTADEVRAEVRSNIEAFARCGGYMVANSHHSLPDIRGENIEAMCEAARECTF